MLKYEILSQLNKYKGKDRVRLHMPGHKNSSAFRAHFPVAPIDFTELSFSDDLNCPTSVIKKAEDDLAHMLGATRAYITTDGSSSGVMAMLFVAKLRGGKIILPRNSHKSAYNACRILGIEPVIVQGEQKHGVLDFPSAELIETLIVNDRDISGILVTSPDYYGNIAPLTDYSKVLKKYGRLLFVDSAHGAALAAEKSPLHAAYCGADMWVDGAHKSLPTLTQGALVCVKGEELLSPSREAMSIFRTTSPSYPIMASVEYGYKFVANNPRLCEKAHALAEQLKKDLEGFTFYPSQDWTKLVIDFKPLGISPKIAQTELEKRGIYAEMCDGRYLLFYLSIGITAFAAMELKSALLSVCAQKKLKGTYKELPHIPTAERTYSFLYAYKSRSEWVPLKAASGRMCADNAGITPPCIPVVAAGEMITPQVIRLLSDAENTFGILDGKIKVVAQK